MKIKFTWGTAILVVIILFILGIIGFFTFSSRQEYFLVEEDYYEKELKYQEQIDKMINTKSLSEPLAFIQTGDTLLIRYPGSFRLDSLIGGIHFYRPSDSRMDKMVDLQPDATGTQTIDLSHFQPGKFILKVEWKMNGLSYYQEHTLIINKNVLH